MDIRQEILDHCSEFKNNDANKSRLYDVVSDAELNKLGMMLHKHKAYVTNEELDILVYLQRHELVDVEEVIILLSRHTYLSTALAVYVVYNL